MNGPLRQRVKKASSIAREAAQIGRDLARERRRHRPSPPAPGEGLVLDVGGGQAPSPRADLVVDKYIADDFERSANQPLDISRPLIIADAESLPFADKSFAYVVASHVLEHATDPERFAAELSRVANAGYVQVPSRESELAFGWPFHPWLIDLEDGVLVFHGRDNAAAPVGQIFHSAVAQSRLFGLWFSQTRSLWHHSVDWVGELEVRREPGEPQATTADFDVEQTQARIAALSPRGLKGPAASLLALTRCPIDHGTFVGLANRQESDPLVCSVCARAYPVVRTVPLLLAEAAS
jgi:uncharacterized protein YbaR (Trm112 family)